MLSIDYSRMSNVFVDLNIGAKDHNFNILFILEKYNIMIVKQKLNYAGICFCYPFRMPTWQFAIQTTNA